MCKFLPQQHSYCGADILKPLVFSETGPGNEDLHDCDNGALFIKGALYSAFSGAAGSAMNWAYQDNSTQQWTILGNLNNLMQGIKLDEENWQPGEPVVPDYSNNLDDEPIEVYYLVSEQSSTNAPRKAVGVICNMTYNYWTQGNGSPCDLPSYDPDIPYNTISDYEFQDVSDLTLKIPNMGSFKDYNVNWINALSGTPIIGTLQSTGLSGKLELDYPQTLTGDQSQPILFFEIYPQGSTFKTPDNQDVFMGTHSMYNKEEFTNIELGQGRNTEIKISPNPTSSRINVGINVFGANYSKWIVTDIKGKIVKSGNIREPNFTIDISVLESGMYYLHIQNERVRQSFKIIKE